MVTTVVLVSVNSSFLHREEISYAGDKWEAYYEAEAIASRMGLARMRSWQTTVNYKHFIIVFGTVGGRRVEQPPTSGKKSPSSSGRAKAPLGSTRLLNNALADLGGA